MLSRRNNHEAYNKLYDQQLKQGHKGEDYLSSRFPDLINCSSPVKTRHGIRYVSDFICEFDLSLIIEAKTDNWIWKNARSESLSIERHPSMYKTNGGPWQAVDKGAKYTVHRLAKTGVVYIYENKPLCRFMEERYGEADFVFSNDESHTWILGKAPCLVKRMPNDEESRVTEAENCRYGECMAEAQKLGIVLRVEEQELPATFKELVEQFEKNKKGLDNNE